MSTIKVTNITPQSGTNVYLTGSLTISETLIAKEVRTELTQSVVLFQSGSTKFGDTADDTHTFSGSLLINGSTTQVGQINATGITGSVKSTNGVVSSSAQIQELGFASDLELNASSSALTTAYTNADTSLSSSLVTTIDSVSSSLASSITSTSSSLAADITTEANNVDNLQTDSGSFSTRVTNLESFSSSLDATYATDAEVSTAVSALNAATSSYATNVTLNTVSASVDSLNAATSSYALNTTLNTVSSSVDNLNAATASYATSATHISIGELKALVSGSATYNDFTASVLAL